MAHDAFISYSSKDRTVAEAVCALLEQNKVRCWIAARDIGAGSDWGESIIEGINHCHVMVLVFSRSANESPQIRREVERAVNKGVIIVPFRIEDVIPTRSLEYFIGSVHWLDALTPPLEDHLKKLAATVQHLLKPDTDGIAAPSVQSRAPDRLGFERAIQDPKLLVGNKAGDYVLSHFIGSGGSGMVFAAWDHALGRKHCVKVLYPFSRDDLGAVHGAISRGIRGLASLSHENIIKLHHFGRFDLADASSFYITMELVEGMNLRDWAWTRSPDPAACFKMAIAITRALQAAHTCKYIDDVGFEQTGVLHGDIKPPNILVRSNDTPVLLDFMLVDVQRRIAPEFFNACHQPEPKDRITAEFGTPGYMAPEQDKEGIVTVRTDIYSLGVTLSEMFFRAGEKWTGANLEKVWCELSPLVALMCAPNPNERPADTAEVINGLLRVAVKWP